MDQQTNDLIKNEIENNEVCLFMKGTPDAPQCGFSMATSNILKILEVNFKGVNVLENQNLREGIKVFSDWPTIPQLYVKNEFIGGCDMVKEEDTVEIRDKSKQLAIIDIALANKEREAPEYIQLDEKNKKFKFIRIPKFEEVPYPIVMEPNLVIEYYSR